MPRRHRQSAIALLITGTAIASAACGSSSKSSPTAPKGPSAAALAAYYDALAGQLLDSAGNDTLVAQGIGIFNGIIADGVTPSRVSVTINGVDSLWYGNAATFVDSAAEDSEQVVALWSDTLATTIIIAEYQFNELSSVQAVVRGGDLVTATTTASDTGSSVFGLTNGVCSLTSITNANVDIPTYDPVDYTCQSASGLADFSVGFPSGDATASGAIQSASLAYSPIIAVRLQGVTETTGVPFARVPRLVHRLGQLRRRR
jgi:hypothetical protein